MSASAPAPKDSPLMQAWDAYQATPEYSNSKGWAMQIAPMVQHGHPDEEGMRRFDIMPRAQREVHIQGAMWAAFMAGFNASRTEAGHEDEPVAYFQYIPVDRSWQQVARHYANEPDVIPLYRRPVPSEAKDGEWRPIDGNTPTDRMLLGIVDGAVRFIKWGKTSHVPIYGWCLADQGVEDFDICEPDGWMPMPAPLPQEG